MAIVTHTFLDKSNTILEGDCINLGLNPILELYYGTHVSRGLVHFDLTKLKKLVNDKTYPDLKKLHHRLKMQNVAGLRTNYQLPVNKYNEAFRASSFDLVFFTINKNWDMGRGFDYLKDGYDTVNRIYSTEGSNWHKATNTTGWDKSGIYSNYELEKHIVARQHFDIGNESIDVDLTDVVNDMIVGDIENNGIGIAFQSNLEEMLLDTLQYVGFFTDHTHTFFHPYLETVYEDTIQDDRTNFYLDKDNRLYFYASVGSKMVNLDNLPTCAIEGSNKTVKQATKGVYYVELNMSSETYEPETMFYDIWSNLSYNGKKIPDQELYFTTKSPEGYFSFGLPYETKQEEKIVPSIFGINHKEQMEQNDIRKVHVSCKIAYTTKQEAHVNDLCYRLYSKAGEAEIDVINWYPVEQGYNENYFLIDTKDLAPGRYFISIKFNKNQEEFVYKELCEFDILDKKKDMKC